MTYIDLPRALEDYFAFAEIDPTRNGRRFTICLPYFRGERIDRLQWWYYLTRAEEQRFGDTALETLRTQAIERFRRHIERWLQNTGQRLYGEGPIPRIGPIEVSDPDPASVAPETPASGDPPAQVPPWPSERVANG